MSFPAKTPTTARDSEKRSIGKGVFSKCRGCGEVLTAEELSQAWYVCPHCQHHHPMPPEAWRGLLLDQAELERWEEHIAPADPLSFHDGLGYRERLKRAQDKTGYQEGIEVGRAQIDQISIAYGCFVFAFMGGSMGSVVGERITRLFERARNDRLPVVLLHASGGARMQEGILSLMQMAKTVAALRRFRDVKRPFISICVHPTTGGVAASTALLGDINVVEPNALIGFAGPRVIENTIKTKLPPGFQLSEFLLSHGMVDCIVSRPQMKQTLALLLTHLMGNKK